MIIFRAGLGCWPVSPKACRQISCSVSLAGFSSVAAPSCKGVWENNYQFFFSFCLASRRKRIPTLVKLKANLKSGSRDAGSENRKDLPSSVWGEIGRGGGVLELGGEGQICQNTRRKTDVLRRDDTEFKIKLHEKLHSWVTPNQNSTANGLITSVEI